MSTTVTMKDGNREDLIDIITNITPDETPLMSRFGKTEAKAMTHAWLTDSLSAPAANKHLEDADYQVAAATPRVRLSNYIQIFMKGYYTTDSQEKVLKAGVKSEIAYQMAKAMKEIARDVEYAIMINATATEGTGIAAGQMGGIPTFNTENAVDMGSAALTETKFNDAVFEAWKDGGNPEVAIVSGKNKRVISGWTGGGQKTRAQAEKKIIQVIDVYESDYGLVKMMAHRMQPDTRVDIIETQYWKLAYLIPFKTVDIPKDSLKTAKVITGQLTLECRTKDAHASIINVV